MKTLRILGVLPILLVLAAASSCSKNNGTDTPENWPSDSIRTLKSGLQFPWEILWGKDDQIWMTERGGRISRVNAETGETTFTTTIPDVVSQGEGGLLGMVQHPDFLTNGYVYVVYNYNNNGSYREKVVRFTFQNGALANPFVLIDNIAASNIHNGSRLLISSDNKIFITTGDASNAANAQNTGSVNGKILRLNLDGSIPADNPIANNPYWSYGHRNAQGLVMVNNILYASEHGPDVQDELNIIEKGQNYGWQNVTQNIKAPIWNTGNVTLAVCGLDYYNNDRIGEWKNSLLLTTLKDATLYRFSLGSNGQSVSSPVKYFSGRWGRLRDLCVSPAGRVYLCTSNGDNKDVLVEVSKLD